MDKKKLILLKEEINLDEIIHFFGDLDFHDILEEIFYHQKKGNLKLYISDVQYIHLDNFPEGYFESKDYHLKFKDEEVFWNKYAESRYLENDSSKELIPYDSIEEQSLELYEIYLLRCYKIPKIACHKVIYNNQLHTIAMKNFHGDNELFYINPFEEFAAKYPLIEEFGCVYVKSSEFISLFKDALNLEPYITKNHIEITDKQLNDDYQLSRSLNLYNDIILAFNNSEDYKKYGEATQSIKHIQPWLKENYLDKKIINTDDFRVLIKFIKSHYNIK
ncbi:hypothetical protein ACFPDQ_07090 [Pseudofrancisella aestuarii]|uniref:Uncharacterized protein n=1 Tax=Pseudofrancisella aestuarii TaxID=2670347 RepID=A0ABV9TDJ8_9GAMM|nr:hypothetical protein [Pseudofrancisella aestuarii]